MSEEKSTTKDEKVLGTDNKGRVVKVTRLFNKIDLTKAVKKAKEEKPVVKRVMKAKVKVGKNYKEEKNVSFDTFFKSQPGSVQDYLNECHPDVRTFIKNNEACSIKGEPGKLIILTRNKFRVEISDVGVGERKVRITDKRGEILSEAVTKLIKSEKTKTKLEIKDGKG